MVASNLFIDLSDKNIEQVIATGDIHGNFTPLIYDIKNNISNNSAVVVCGDIGLGFLKKRHYLDTFKKINKELSDRNIYLVFLRGNHDDPAYFIYGSDEEWDTSYTNIIVVPDYTTVKFNEDITGICIGGAVSVDRQWRKLENKPWWENEGVYPPLMSTDSDFIMNLEEYKPNVIFSHTATSHHELSVGGVGEAYFDKMKELGDSSLKDDLEDERSLMDNIYNNISEHTKINVWVCGHFHFGSSKIEVDPDTGHETKFIVLDMLRDPFYSKRKFLGDYFTIEKEK